jgi:hypothetical protein
MSTFDSTKACPIIRNFQCAEADCGFWNADKAECIFWDEMAGKQDYNEVAGTITGAKTNQEIDLGAVYRDITIWIDQAVTVRLHSVTGNVLTFNTTYGRVGTPVYVRRANARYLYITTTVTTNYLIDGNG